MKKKIIFIVHQLNIGGVQKSFVTAVNSLDRERFDITVYVRKNRVELLDGIDPDGLEIIVNDDKNNYYRTPSAVFLTALTKLFGFISPLKKRIENKIRNLIILKQSRYEYERFFKDRRFDAAVSYIQGLTAEFTAKYINADTKAVFWHGSTDENHALHEEIFPSFDKIIGVSENIENILKGLYPSFGDKITHLDNFVDAELIRALAKKETVNRSDELTLCSCGRFTPVKGYDIAVEAARLIKEKNGGFKWYFVGDGPERAKLEKLISDYGLKDNIIITGFLTNPYPYMAACDIFIQPSYEEAYGLSIVEALILSKPVVSTKTVGGMTLVKDGENGCLSDISPEGLAEEIFKLSANKNLLTGIMSNLEKTGHQEEKTGYQKRLNGLF